MRKLFKWAILLAAVYVVLTAGLFVSMLQPPATFGRVMARLPTVAYAVFPFRLMWLVARNGTLHIGDVAPEFSLKTPDGSGQVSLSSFKGHQAVVLIFGSHT